MSNLVSRTALRGVSQSPYDKMAQGLGYFSIGLGLAELLAPQALCRMLDMEGDETLIRAYGARELATGVAILTSHDPTPWIWGRVAGDAVDIGTLATANRGTPEKRDDVIGAFAALVAVTALDAICAKGLMAEKALSGGTRTDYSGRSGFPRPPNAMRGAASDFEVPRDMRVPDLLRPDVFERHGGAGMAPGSAGR
jgi:hypothetical protein